MHSFLITISSMFIQALENIPVSWGGRLPASAYDKRRSEPVEATRFMDASRSAADLRLLLNCDPLESNGSGAARDDQLIALLRCFIPLPRDQVTRLALVRTLKCDIASNSLFHPALHTVRHALYLTSDNGDVGISEEDDISASVGHTAIEPAPSIESSSKGDLFKLPIDLLPGLVEIIDSLRVHDRVSVSTIRLAADRATSWAFSWTSPARSMKVGVFIPLKIVCSCIP